MQSFLKFKKTISCQILATGVLISGTALLFDASTAAKGFALGSLFSLLNFRIMARQAPGMLGKERKAASVGGFFNLGLRLIIMALPLALAFKRPEIDVLWTALGLLNLQFSVIVYGFVAQRFGLTDEPTV